MKLDSPSGKREPPPLPARRSGNTETEAAYSDEPPPYDTVIHEPASHDTAWQSRDPRSSSTQSLLPPGSDETGDRRKLLLIYIHGFMGNETSFRSFPAHVHNLLTVLLAETHVVHSKIYPRYRSKRKITFARDDFSKWLEPHEDPSTDVILLGHSMGGLLSAEVVLMSPPPPESRPVKHRILGTINFDVPFLGMHPGVVKSGLSSIFRPAEEARDKWSSESGPQSGASNISPEDRLTVPPTSTDALWGTKNNDPNFNPNFANDVVLPIREGWRNAWHFMQKHSDDLVKASTKLVSSHLEFGGAMANYSELKARYAKIRALEVDDKKVRATVVSGGSVPSRVRFLNYYTACTGRPKRPKSPASQISQEQGLPSKGAAQGDDENHPSRRTNGGSDIADEDFNEAAETLTVESTDGANAQASAPTFDGETRRNISSTSSSCVPPLPDLPPAPPQLDVSDIYDSATRKAAEKEHDRHVKAYEKAVKDREKAVRDRERAEEKNRRKAEKAEERASKEQEREKKRAEKMGQDQTHQQREEMRLAQERERMAAEGRRMRGEADPEKNPTVSLEESEGTTNHTISRAIDASASDSERTTAISRASSTDDNTKPRKDRTFCTLPPKESNGGRDKCWVRVFMKDVDEVGAHCGLFFVDERYERLVGEVSERIEGWVKEDQSERLYMPVESVD